LVPPVVREYFTYLESQGSNRWKRLPKRLQSILAPEYIKAFLSKVRYAENINTVHGQAITVENNIYFPTSINLNNYSDMSWLLHELEHVSQYQVHGGKTSFVIKYLANGVLEIGRNGSIDIHDAINLERDADNKSNRILDKVWRKWNQKSSSSPPHNKNRFSPKNSPPSASPPYTPRVNTPSPSPVYPQVNAPLGALIQTTTSMTNQTGQLLNYNLFSASRPGVEWPVNYVYSGQTYTAISNCNQNEKICFGAWNQFQIWGVGPQGNYSCQNCCFFCDGQTKSFTLQ
jgi:hypothetical protein